eukprot:Gb_00468 [translate_table: standard]
MYREIDEIFSQTELPLLNLSFFTLLLCRRILLLLENKYYPHFYHNVRQESNYCYITT